MLYVKSLHNPYKKHDQNCVVVTVRLDIEPASHPIRRPWAFLRLTWPLSTDATTTAADDAASLSLTHTHSHTST